MSSSNDRTPTARQGRSQEGDGSGQKRRKRSSSGGAHMAQPNQQRSRQSSQRSQRSGQRSPGQRDPRRQQRAPQQRTGQQQRTASQRPQQRRKRTSMVVPIVIIVAVLAVVGVGGFFLYRQFTSFKLTVNGQEVTMHRGDTVEKLLDEGYATPKPGNLLAVDGELLTKGEGERCTVTINGAAATINSELSGDTTVEITDGGDKTEEATETEEAIPYGKSSDDTSFAGYWNGSIHLLSDGEDGVRVVKTGKVSGKTVDEVVKAPIDAGYHNYTVKTDDKVIALTFDDGPWPETTDQILDLLQQYDAKATFFVIGNQVSNYASQLKRAYDMGCQICTHTWDHAAGSGQGVSIALMSADEQINEVKRGYQAIADAIGVEPDHILRAPGGNFYGDVIDNLWPYVDAEIGWDVDTEDWSRPGTDSIVQMIMSVQPGQVILMHDGGGDRSQTVEALRQTLPQLVEQGYKFVTINDLLAYGLPQNTLSSIPTTTGESSSSSYSSTSTGSTSTTGSSSSTDSTDSTSTLSGSDSSDSGSSNSYSSSSTTTSAA